MSGITKAERQKRQEEAEKAIREDTEKKLREEYDARIACLEEKIASLRGGSVGCGIQKNTVVPVISNSSEPLLYVSKSTIGYTVEWEHIGSVEYMEIGELISMRSTDRRFFEDNWIILGDTEGIGAKEIYEYLKVAKYYENIPDRHTPDLCSHNE